MAGKAKRSIIIEILGDAKDYAKSAKQAEGATGSFEKKVNAVGKAIAGAYMVKKIVDYGVASVKAAANDAAAQTILATTLRKTTQATDGQIASVEEWITKTSHHTGVLDDELRPSLGNLLRATKDQTKSQDLLSLAMDVSRGTGKDLETVSAAIAKAYSGNTTALAKLVPGIKLAGEGTLSFADAQSRLNDQFGGQAAAYAETAEGRMARLNAQYADMQESIGTALLPVMEQLVGVLTTAFGWFNDLSPATQELILKIALLAGGLYVGVSAFNAVREAVKAFGLSMQSSMGWLAAAGIIIGGIVTAVAMFSETNDEANQRAMAFYDTVRSGTSALDLQRLAFLSATDAAAEFADAAYAKAEKDLRDKIGSDKEYLQLLTDLGLEFSDLDEIVRGSAGGADALSTAHAGLLEEARKMTGITDLQSLSVTEVTKGWLRQGRAMNGTERQIAANIQVMADFEDVLTSTSKAQYDSTEIAVQRMRAGDAEAAAWLKATGQLAALSREDVYHAEKLLEETAAIETTTAATEELTTANERASTANDYLSRETIKTRDALDETAQVANDLKSAIDAIFAPYANWEQAQRNIRQGTADLSASLEENGATLDINTEKGRANREAVESQAEAIRDFGVAMVGQGKSTDEAAAYMEALTEQMLQQLEATGMNREEAEAYIATLGMTPANIRTTVKLAEADTAKRELEDLLSQLDDVDAGVSAEIKADIANGDFDRARAKIDDLAKERGVTLRVGVTGGGTITTSPGNGGTYRIIAYAKGGNPVEGETALVGEKGPELVTFGHNSTVHPADETRRILGAGASRSGGVVEQHNHVHIAAGAVVSDRELTEMIAAGLSTAARRTGSDVTTRRRAPV